MANLSELAREEDVLRVVIDYGSRFVKVGAAHCRAGQPPSDLSIQDIPLEPGRKRLQQKLIVDGDNIIHGANAVRDWIAKHPEQADKVIEMHKLCLSPDHINSPAAMRVWKALDARPGDLAAVQELLTKHLIVLHDAVFRYYRQGSANIHSDSSYWDSIKLETSITVPCLWDETAHGIMRNAANSAGFPNVSLRLEPLCAAAYDINKMRTMADHDSEKIICFEDIGGSTQDLAVVRMGRSHDGAKTATYSTVGVPAGSVAGGNYVNDLAWKSLPERPEVRRRGGIEEVCRRLGGMSEFAFSRRFSDEIEHRKKEFPSEESYVVAISAKPGWQLLRKGESMLVIAYTRYRRPTWKPVQVANVIQGGNGGLVRSMGRGACQDTCRILAKARAK